MKLILKLIWIAIFLFVLIIGNLMAQIDTLVILHINDTHSHLTPFGPKDTQGVGTMGSFARLATIIKEVKTVEKNILLFHAGDLFTGDFMSNKYHTVPELQFYKDLGFDALTIGNHEFDRTPETLKRAFREAGFPLPGFDLLSANLDMSQEPELAELVKPYTIKEVGNVKVGIFGLTIERTTNNFSFPDPVVVTDYIEAGRTAVDSLRSKCDIVIGLTHLGFELDSTLVDSVAGIDIIIGGHDHRAHFTPRAVTNPDGKTTWIARAGAYCKYIGYMKLAYSPSELNILEYELKPIDHTVVSDPEVETFLEELKDSLQADPRYGPVYDEIIAEAAFDINQDIRAWYKDSPMGNLITDAFREATGTDVAIDVTGFIRQDIYQGLLAGNDIFQAISEGYDDNTGYGLNLVTFELLGINLRNGLAFTAVEALTDQDFYVQVSGLEFKYNSSFPSLIFIVKDLKIGGQPIKVDSLYTITTSDKLAGFLSYAGLEPVNLQETGLSEYEVVRDYIIAKSPIAYHSEGRVQDLAYTAVREQGYLSQSSTYQLNQNYPNPFNLMTTINFSVPEQCHVDMTIYNLNGQKVKQLISKSFPAGTHQINWNGTDNLNEAVGTGVYVVVFNSGKHRQSKKILLLK